MSLTRLDYRGVRNLEPTRLSGLARVNVFFGANGSGKTSLLEAVHLLGMARSFRSAHIKSVITHGEDSCTVFGEILSPRGNKATMGVSRNRGGDLDARVNGQKVGTRAELAETLPLQVIHADSVEILTGGPVDRRQFMDWGVFHVEHAFFRHWQVFQRAIKQRNSLLRRGRISDDLLRPWDEALAESGGAIDTARAAYIDALAPVFVELLERLAPEIEAVELKYRRGWDVAITLHEALQQSLSVDLQQGFTHAGPQRADLRIVTNGKLAADCLSRGQLKLVVCALKLAQGRLLAEQRGALCTYLVDDLTAELDLPHCIQVARMLSEMEAQVFVTCIERKDVTAVWPTADANDHSMFHVEHGRIVRESA